MSVLFVYFWSCLLFPEIVWKSQKYQWGNYLNTESSKRKLNTEKEYKKTPPFFTSYTNGGNHLDCSLHIKRYNVRIRACLYWFEASLVRMFMKRYNNIRCTHKRIHILGHLSKPQNHKNTSIQNIQRQNWLKEEHRQKAFLSCFVCDERCVDMRKGSWITKKSY